MAGTTLNGNKQYKPHLRSIVITQSPNGDNITTLIPAKDWSSTVVGGQLPLRIFTLACRPQRRVPLCTTRKNRRENHVLAQGNIRSHGGAYREIKNHDTTVLTTVIQCLLGT